MRQNVHSTRMGSAPKRACRPKQEGQPTFTKAKGRFTWGKNIEPVYAWYNGSVGAYVAGDRVEGDGLVKVSYPLGARGEPGARIAP